MSDKDLCKALGIKQTELNQLREYVRDAYTYLGDYWGNKEQFYKRDDHIRSALGMEQRNE